MDDKTRKFIEEAKNVHGDKYDYSHVNYIGNKKPVMIICPKHGAWMVKPLYHLQGRGCPDCKESHLERNVRELLQNKNIEFIREKKFEWIGKKRLDFYLPNQNIVFECQGVQHFTDIHTFGGTMEFSELLKRDIDKYNECTNHGLKIIYVIDDKLKINLCDERFCGIYHKNNTFKFSNLKQILESDDWCKKL